MKPPYKPTIRPWSKVTGPAAAFADGEAGDRVKYLAAGRSMLKRWKLSEMWMDW